jgi:hypothetical protein
MRVKFRNVESDLPPESVIDYTTFNTERIQTPLNCLNLMPVNGVKVETIPEWAYAQNKSPVGGSPLFQTEAIRLITPAVTVRVWARMQDSTMEEVFSYTLTDEDVYRLPSDFMSDVWQFEFVSNTDIYSFAIAETAKELVQV